MSWYRPSINSYLFPIFTIRTIQENINALEKRKR